MPLLELSPHVWVRTEEIAMLDTFGAGSHERVRVHLKSATTQFPFRELSSDPQVENGKVSAYSTKTPKETLARIVADIQAAEKSPPIPL